jgi:hypothetical protein
MNDLQCYSPIQGDIERAKGDTHRPATKLPQSAIIASRNRVCPKLIR